MMLRLMVFDGGFGGHGEKGVSDKIKNKHNYIIYNNGKQ